MHSRSQRRLAVPGKTKVFVPSYLLSAAIFLTASALMGFLFASCLD